MDDDRGQFVGVSVAQPGGGRYGGSMKRLLVRVALGGVGVLVVVAAVSYFALFWGKVSRDEARGAFNNIALNLYEPAGDIQYMYDSESLGAESVRDYISADLKAIAIIEDELQAIAKYKGIVRSGSDENLRFLELRNSAENLTERMKNIINVLEELDDAFSEQLIRLKASYYGGVNETQSLTTLVYQRTAEAELLLKSEDAGVRSIAKILDEKVSDQYTLVRQMIDEKCLSYSAGGGLM